MCSRDMCLEISSNWGSQTWQDFDQLCEYNPVETELINCLADVREPCQLGCKDLTYCTNFNNRSVFYCSPTLKWLCYGHCMSVTRYLHM